MERGNDGQYSHSQYSFNTIKTTINKTKKRCRMFVNKLFLLSSFKSVLIVNIVDLKFFILCKSLRVLFLFTKTKHKPILKQLFLTSNLYVLVFCFFTFYIIHIMYYFYNFIIYKLFHHFFSLVSLIFVIYTLLLYRLHINHKDKIRRP